MHQKTKIREHIFILLLLSFVGVVLTSLSLKEQVLDFHSRDYPFFMRFYTTAFDNNLLKDYIINPVGESFLGHFGADGFPNFYYFLHFSPIKYIAALLFFIGGKFALKSLFVFMMLMPIWMIWQDRVKNNLDANKVIFVFASCLLIPAWSEYATYDYRPIMLFLPNLVALIYFINKGRTSLLAFALMLCLIREEALIFILMGVFHLFVKSEYRKAGYLYIALLIYLLGMSLYYYLSPYNLHSYNTIYSLVCCVAFCPVFGVVLHKLKTKKLDVIWVNIIYLLPLFYGFYKMFNRHPIKGDWNVAFDELFYGARWYLLSGLFAVFIASFLYDKILKNKDAALVYFLSAIMFIESGLYFYNHNYKRWNRPSAESESYQDIKPLIEKAKLKVVTGFAGLQVFYNLDNIIVWQRLPVKYVPSLKLSATPYNKKYLVGLSDAADVFVGHEYEYSTWQQAIDSKVKTELCYRYKDFVIARNVKKHDNCTFLLK